MPAIAPPLRPLLLFVVAAVLVVAVLEGEDVDEEVNKGCIEEVATTGKTTFAHRVSLSEKTQHESVEFGELEAQYEHKLPVLSEKPQLLGWFVTPSIQVPVNESAGSAQLVKSALIWLRALFPAVPHTLLAVMSSSLCAYSAWSSVSRDSQQRTTSTLTQVSAHKGLAAVPERVHSVIEF